MPWQSRKKKAQTGEGKMVGRTGKWLRNFFVRKKDKDRDKDDKENNKQSSAPPAENPTTPIPFAPATPREKRRWSFRRSSATSASLKDSSSSSSSTPETMPASSSVPNEQKKHALAVAAATAAAADAAVAAAQAAAAVIRLTAGVTSRASPVEEAAAIRIQSVYRSCLARKALRALRGIVKLQALVRGHLVRRLVAAMLRCMQANATSQARARIHRLRMSEESRSDNPRPSPQRRSTREDRSRLINHEMDKGSGESIKIVEIDTGEPKTPSVNGRSCSSSRHPQPELADHKSPAYSKRGIDHSSLAASALAVTSPRTCSDHFEDYDSFETAQSSPQCYSALAEVNTARTPFSIPRPEYTKSISHDCPSYMADTESWRAKGRSQSVPKQRLEYFERQPSVSRRASVEGWNSRMQRSSSAARNYQWPWSSIKLDKWSTSPMDSECGSTSTVLRNTNYRRSLLSYETHGNRYQKGPPPPHQAARVHTCMD